MIDLIVREVGEPTAARFVSRLHPQGPAAALQAVFGGNALVGTEGEWRAHLARLAGAQ